MSSLSSSSSSSNFINPTAVYWVDYADLFTLFSVWYFAFMLLTFVHDTILYSIKCCDRERSTLTLEDIGEKNVATIREKKRTVIHTVCGVRIDLHQMDKLLAEIDSYVSCVVLILWIWRSYFKRFPTGQKTFELVFDFFFAGHFLYRLARDRTTLTQFSLSPFNIIDAFAITSSFHATYQSLWLNFSFCRFISIFVRGPFKTIVERLGFNDFKVQVVQLVEKIFIIVIGFACTILTFETLGELPFFADDNEIEWTVFNSVYFIFITLSTVGYGDLSPITVPGRIAVITFIVVGVISFGEASQQLLELGSRTMSGLGRNKSRWPFILLCGDITPSMLKDFMNELYSKDRLSINDKSHYREIVVMVENKQDGHLKDLRESIANFHKARRVRFYIGSPLNVHDLDRCDANSDLCEGVFVMGDGDTEERDDIRHIFGSVSTKMYNPRLPVFLLLYSSDNQTKLDSISSEYGPDVVIYQERFEMTVLGMNVLSQGYSTLLYHLVDTTSDLDHSNQDEIEWFPCKKISRVIDQPRSSSSIITDWNEEYLNGASHEVFIVLLNYKYNNQTYINVVRDIYNEYQIIMMGVVIDGKLHYHCDVIKENTFALIICKHGYEALLVGSLMEAKDIRNEAEFLKSKEKNIDEFKTLTIHADNTENIAFPCDLMSIESAERIELLKNHIVLICAASHFDALQYFIKPIREYEYHLKKLRKLKNVSLMPIVIIIESALTDDQIKLLDINLDIICKNDLYWYTGSPFKTDTLAKVHLASATKVVVAGHKFSAKSPTAGAFNESDLVFVLLGIRKFLDNSVPMQDVDVVSQIAHPSIIRFLHNPMYDEGESLLKTTAFASGSAYLKNTARLCLISSFFSPAASLLVESITRYNNNTVENDNTILQIPIRFFRKAGTFKGVTFGELFIYLNTLHIIPISIYRNNKHLRGNIKCCIRTPPLNNNNTTSPSSKGEEEKTYFFTSPVKCVLLSPPSDMILCDMDEVVFYDYSLKSWCTEMNNVMNAYLSFRQTLSCGPWFVQASQDDNKMPALMKIHTDVSVMTIK